MLQDPILDEPLAELMDQNFIVEVIDVLKSGKEATVCLCRAGERIGGGLVAVKIYRSLNRRSFKNDQLYRDGKVILSGRVRRALANKTEMGRVFQMYTWINYEWETLVHLQDHGLDVPRPLARGGNAIVMDFVGIAAEPAPQLRTIRLRPREALDVFDRVMWNVQRLLSLNVIHADLSPYNVLYLGAGRVSLIDFPQSVDPRENPRSYELLTRDIENVHRHCRKFTADLPDPWKLANRLWDRFLNARL